MDRAMLQPVVVLAGWTLVVLGLLFVKRLPALRAAKIDLRRVVGGRGQDLEGRVPPAAQWPAHNYAHLVEQPTLFYAVALVLALAGAAATDVALAWAYVLLRIVHSVWQIGRNVVFPRFLLFWTGSLVLTILTVRAGLAVL